MRTASRWLTRCRCSLFALALIIAGGCGEPADGRIRFGLPTAPVTLDPRFATDAVSDRLVRLLHRALVEFDVDQRPVAGLASRRRLSPLHYRFTLDATATFTDGAPVTADDVAATYASVLDPATASPHRESLSNIASFAVVDARNLDFYIQRPDELFPATLVIGIMSATDIARGRGRDVVFQSSGNFQRVSWAVDGRVLLRRRIDGVLFEFVPVKDATVRALKLVAGELDIAQGGIPPEIFHWLGTRPGLLSEQVAGTTFSYLGFNLEQGPATRREVRLAIAHAIDRDAIVRHLFAGTARPAQTLFPPTHWAGADDLQAPAYDPDAARSLLRQVGYGGEPLELEYKTSGDPFRLRIASALQYQLAQVGIALKIQSLDWGTFYGDVKNGRFEIYSLSWVGLKLPDIFRYAFHSSAIPPAGANRGRYRNDVADALIEQAERAGELRARAQLYRALEQRLLYDLPYIPLWFEDHLVVTASDIVGYTTDADGSFDALARTYRRPE